MDPTHRLCSLEPQRYPGCGLLLFPGAYQGQGKIAEAPGGLHKGLPKSMEFSVLEHWLTQV